MAQLTDIIPTEDANFCANVVYYVERDCGFIELRESLLMKLSGDIAIDLIGREASLLRCLMLFAAIDFGVDAAKDPDAFKTSKKCLRYAELFERYSDNSIEKELNIS